MDPISDLLAKRKTLFEQLEQLPPFRPGTIYMQYRKCGKKNCACAQPNHPGHGPQFLWTVSLNGKNHTKNLVLGPQVDKYRQETDTYHRFQALSAELVTVNQQICDISPTLEVASATELDMLKKKLLKIYKRKLASK